MLQACELSALVSLKYTDIAPCLNRPDIDVVCCPVGVWGSTLRQLVTHSPDRQDMPRLGRVLFDLLPEGMDVYI
jgi:hypothetical protein